MAGLISQRFKRQGAKFVDARLALAVVLIVVALSPAAFATAEQNLMTITASRVENTPASSRLTFDLTGVVDARVWPMTNPARLIVDLPDVAFALEPSAGRVTGSKLIRAFRFGQFAAGRGRIVIDLAAPAAAIKVASEPTGSGARLTIELAPTSASRFAADAQAANAFPDWRLTAVDAESAKVTNRPADKPVVMIDPGHGGVDQGAVAENGIEEKTIVLAFARALRDRIEASGRLHAVLTRDDDVFLPLEARVALAHRANAALFLSIHADTLAAPHVEGATIYTLSRAASDIEAARTATQENHADLAAGMESPATAADSGEIDDILLDLTRRETSAFSRQFAQTLALRWREAGSLNKNPTRSAGFVVLKAHDIPSALLELGYVSSPRDLARLTSSAWREQAANKAAEAIEAFFVSHRQTQMLAAPAGSRPE
jgi:N-acetylmuramoyl-L-alanine amidase